MPSARPVPGEVEGQQLDLRFVPVGRGADDPDELVQVRQRDQVAFEGFRALFGFAQLKLGPADDDFAPVLDVAVDQLFQPERLGRP